jgi:hypothetical protein
MECQFSIKKGEVAFSKTHTVHTVLDSRLNLEQQYQKLNIITITVKDAGTIFFLILILYRQKLVSPQILLILSKF